MLLVTACGFHLRGDAQFPENLNPLYIDAGELQASQLKLIRDVLKKTSAKLTDLTQGSNHLAISLSPLQRKEVASSSLSDVELLQLSMSIEYHVATESGNLLFENRQIAQSTEVELDSANVLSHESLINKAQQALQKRLIHSMVFQLSH